MVFDHVGADKSTAVFPAYESANKALLKKTIVR